MITRGEKSALRSAGTEESATLAWYKDGQPGNDRFLLIHSKFTYLGLHFSVELQFRSSTLLILQDVCSKNFHKMLDQC